MPYIYFWFKTHQNLKYQQNNEKVKHFSHSEHSCVYKKTTQTSGTQTLGYGKFNMTYEIKNF